MANKDMTQKFFDPAKLAVVYHPGETLQEKLEEMGMSVKEFATRVSKPEKTIFAVLNGKSSVTPDMAVAFELITQIPASMWLRLQNSYDEYIARSKREAAKAEGIKWAEKFPYEEMAQRGWFAAIDNIGGKPKDMFETLCSFFAVSSPKGWEDYYLNQRLRVAFRVTLADSCDPYALSAWLRRGEIQAAEIRLDAPYSSKLLRGKLDEVVSVKNSGAEDVIGKVIGILASSGIKLFFTETLKSAPVKGCTRYINNIPCIQLAETDEADDEFWRTLFHEIGHILLHGKKEIFMENVDYGDKDERKEAEADDFAETWMSK